MTLYNYSSVQAGTFGSWFSFGNTVTSNWFMPLVVMAIFLILLIIFVKNQVDAVRALLVSSWIGFIVAAIAWLGGWLAIVWVFGYLVLSASLFIYLTMNSSSY